MTKNHFIINRFIYKYIDMKQSLINKSDIEECIIMIQIILGHKQ